MYVLHAHWQPPVPLGENGGVLFWAESAEATPFAKMERRGRKAMPHPFCADDKTVRQLLHDLTSEPAQGKASEAMLWLPTTKQGPQPSPQLVHSWDVTDRAAPTLGAWQVSGLWLPLHEALAVLMNLSSAHSPVRHSR